MTWDHGWLNQGAAIAGAMRGIACRGAMHYASQARPWLGYEKHRDRGGGSASARISFQWRQLPRLSKQVSLLDDWQQTKGKIPVVGSL